MNYSVVYSGYCCDTGRFTRHYNFLSIAEAKKFYEVWRKDTERGKYWSDGADYMSIQRLEYCPSCRRDQILESEMINTSRGRICMFCRDSD